MTFDMSKPTGLTVDGKSIEQLMQQDAKSRIVQKLDAERYRALRTLVVKYSHDEDDTIFEKIPEALVNVEVFTDELFDTLTDAVINAVKETST